MTRKSKAKEPRRGKGAITGIGDVLKSLEKSSKLGVQLEQARIWEQWESLVGPKLCRHGQPRGIREGRLLVDVDTTVSMHRFVYRKYGIMRRINAMAKRELVSDIFFRLAVDDEPTPPREE